jgi:hypothetical protein
MESACGRRRAAPPRGRSPPRPPHPARVVDDEAAVRRPVVDVLGVPALENGLVFAHAGRRLRVDVPRALAGRREKDPRSVPGIHRIEIVGRVEGEARSGPALELQEPDVAHQALGVAPAEGDMLAVGREHGVRIIRGFTERLEPATRAVEPGELDLREAGPGPVGEHPVGGDGKGAEAGRPERRDLLGHGRSVAGEPPRVRVERLRHH